MSRRKKEGNRSKNIQGKHGFLYIVKSTTVVEDGKRKTKTKWIPTFLKDIPENVKKAEEIRDALLETPENTTPTSGSNNTSVSDYIDMFLSAKKRTLADTTYSTYSYRGKRIKDYFGNTLLSDVTKEMVEEFLDALFKESKLSHETVKDTRRFFNSAMASAAEDRLRHNNPVTDAKINKQLAAEYTKDKNDDDDFFSYDEVLVFLEAAKEHPLYELFYITVFFGLRREEVLGLKWSSINFRKKTLKITHTVTKGTNINRLNTTKTDASARKYPLSDSQIELLKYLKKQEDEYKVLFGNAYQDNDYIFKHPDGKLYHPDYPSKAFRKLIKRTPGLPQGITLHGLRKSCVSILVHDNMDLKSIQNWVGHKDIETTMKIYAEVKDKEAKNSVSEHLGDIIPIKKYDENKSDIKRKN